MRNKKQCTYVHLWKVLKELFPKFRPEVATADYEDAVRNSLREVFPGIEIIICWFHYNQVIKMLI